MERATAMAIPAGRASGARAVLRWLRPLDNGPQEIRALDGLRAIAALSVVAFHTISGSQIEAVTPGLNPSVFWNYLRSGVHLFFVLSGFLLFMPYARAMLRGRPLPSARQFYRRRALRILPAYWVCLAVLVLLSLPVYLSASGAPNVLLHIALVHNFVPQYDMGIQGVFWTMAVEAQFYVLLPGLAWLLSKLVGDSRSLGRLLAGVVGLALAFVLIRELVGVLDVGTAPRPGWLSALLIGLNSSQGHFLETFATGMFCGTLYVAQQEGRLRRGVRQTAVQGARQSSSQGVRNSPLRPSLAWIGTAMVAGGLLLAWWLAEGVAANRTGITNACYACLNPGNQESVAGPLLIGVSYSAMVLGTLWGAGAVRWLFELAPLRFVGLISYSLYLWHLPLLQATEQHVGGLAPWLRLALIAGTAFVAALPLAYLSYQFVERPFLKLRHRGSADKPASLPIAVERRTDSPQELAAPVPRG
ncbi:MAG TPA: acyltransferase [Ktedonobacterales bacterium]|nr:acyltransferase [Ktedonobacterales bacterium]